MPKRPKTHTPRLTPPTFLCHRGSPDKAQALPPIRPDNLSVFSMLGAADEFQAPPAHSPVLRSRLLEGALLPLAPWILTPIPMPEPQPQVRGLSLQLCV